MSGVAAERVGIPVLPSARRDRAHWWTAGYGVVAGTILFLIAYRGLMDDAHITLGYARNLAFHWHWGLTEFRTANTATSPLNVWLLAAATFVTRNPVLAVGVVLIASTAATGWWSALIARWLHLSPWLLSGLVVSFLVVNPLFVSTVGMETYLGVAVLLGVGWASLSGRTAATGVLCGLAVLCRPDLVVPAAALALGLRQKRGTGRVRVLGRVAVVAAAVALPWHVFSWITLGGFIPDTFAIKTAAGQFGPGETFLTGLYGMAQIWTRAFLLLFATVAAGLIALLAWIRLWSQGQLTAAGRAAIIFGLGGIAHFTAFALVGVPPYHWYYCPAVGLLIISAAISLTAAAHLNWPRAGIAVVGAAALLIGTSAGLLLAAPVPWDKPIIFGNWATAQQYAAAGRDLSRMIPRGETVGGFGEIGVVSFYCDCDIIDPFTDRSKAMDIIREREAKAGPIMGTLLALNYANLDVPAPTRIDHQMEYSPGHGPGWPTNVPGRGVGHLWLSR
ncbi:hypothetical protein [Pseudonocardia sp.]|jgi:hypothetical protein|uniref:hypothetical protein n=1 Tax=Pseudonocardia sp. TaxID=60912 RepID=UPI0031FC0253